MSRLVQSLTALLLAMCGSAGAFASGNFLEAKARCIELLRANREVLRQDKGG